MMSRSEADYFVREEEGGYDDYDDSPTTIREAFLDQAVLRYGPRHRLYITEEEAWDCEPRGPPRNLPQAVLDEAIEWWEECARDCE